ncbi:hypothetical protein BDZ89DRAFT_1094781 [Hymenopellis radicata]|nr:hypothetical protein BDZ89DRAFT_1094781 [Hymenopellis radicata]
MFSLRRVGARTVPSCARPRIFSGRKAFQYNWYTNILKSTTTAPLIFLSRDGFTAERLKKLRLDLGTAAGKVPPPKDEDRLPAPTLTVINSGIFGAALRDRPGLDLGDVQKMIDGIQGGYALLSLPALHPPYVNAILRALDRSVPKRPEKTAEQVEKELAAKTADPSTPGRRMKRAKPVQIPELRVLGLLIEERIILPETIPMVAKMPSLDTLRAQIIGMLSAPSTQLAGVLSQASGGRLHRTLEGFKKALEEKEAPPPASP